MEINQLKIYRSSAGSGKTRNLVFHYVSLLLINPDQYKNILAVTFTNKSTQEMKDRIIALLVSFCETPEKTDINDMCHMTGLTEQEVTVTSARALSNILHDYSSFSISTIDAFFNRIIKSMAIELSLPLNYDIELRTETIISELLRKLYSTLKGNKELLDWLEEYVEYRLAEESSWDPDRPMRNIAKEIFNERFKMISADDLKKPDPDLPEKFFKIKNSFEVKCREFAGEFIKQTGKQGLTTDDFTQKGKGVGSYFKMVLENNHIAVKNYQFNSYVTSSLKDYKWFSGKINPNETFTHSFLNPFADQYLNFFNQNYPSYILAGRMFEAFYLKGILSFLQEQFEKLKLEKNFIHISDNNKILHDLISLEDAPFIFERSGNKYFHFLIDEFQDTSNLQWHNFLPLLHNSLASGNFSMIVGDAKQSIYRWRGGNMELLNNKVENDLSVFKSLINAHHLNTNYRSGHQIVTFNNWFFERSVVLLTQLNLLSNSDALEKTYEKASLLQKTWEQKNDRAAYVSVKKITTSSVKTEDYDNLLKPELLERIIQYRELEYSYSDMCVLVRSKNEGKRIADILTSENIEIITSDSLLISGSPIIKFIINCLKLIRNDQDQLAEKEASFFLHLILKPTTTDPHTIFSNDKNARSTQASILTEQVQNKFSILRKQNTYEIFESLIRMFNLQEADDAFVKHLRDEIIEFCLNESGGLPDFLEHWDNLMNSENETLDISDEKPAIRIMTIHKSKGLQFPVVFIPFTDNGFFPKNGKELLWTTPETEWDQAPGIWPVYYNRSLEQTCFSDIINQENDQSVVDNLNILYVAFTRAESILNVWTKSTKKKPKTIGTANHLIELVIDDKFSEDQYSCGELQTKKITKTEVVNVTQSRSMIYPGQDRFVRLKKQDKEAFESDAITYGNLLHHYMSLINHKDDTQNVIRKIGESESLESADADKLITDIQQMLSSKELATFFDGTYEIINEADILMPNGKTIRPDRLMYQNKNCVILDYKTGSESISDINSHRAQLQLYSDTISKMNFENVNAFIYYVDVGQLINALQ